MHNCLVCKSAEIRLIYQDSLFKCQNCGFITANLEIGKDELKAIYNKNYFNGEEYMDYLADKLVLQKNFAQRIKHLGIKEEKKPKTLEIGCAYGFFGELFAKTFKNAEYHGIDIAKEAVTYGRDKFGLKLILGDYLNCQVSEKYEYIFMWDVIEHLPTPDLVLKKIAKNLAPGGELHITTGDIGALLPRIRKSNWRMIHPPTHLHYFSRNSLCLLLNNHGFEVKEITYKPVYRSVRQIFYSLFLLKKASSGFRNKVLEIIPESWFLPVNTYDIMHCVAIKK